MLFDVPLPQLPVHDVEHGRDRTHAFRLDCLKSSFF